MIADRRDLQSVEHAVARILAQSDQPVEVYEAALEAIGRPLGWEFGAVWEVDRNSGALHCVRTWNIADGAVAREFVALTERLTFAPGVGLPGRVLETGEAAWIFGLGHPFQDLTAARIHQRLRDPLHPFGVHFTTLYQRHT